MSMNDNNDLDFDALKAAKPQPGTSEGRVTPPTAPQVHAWPSRQASAAPEMVQMTVRASTDVADEFRKLCKTERYSYGDMLKILIEAYKSR